MYYISVCVIYVCINKYISIYVYTHICVCHICIDKHIKINICIHIYMLTQQTHQMVHRHPDPGHAGGDDAEGMGWGGGSGVVKGGEGRPHEGVAVAPG